MSDKTGISWTNATWNPVLGCSKVSPGCAHCYAVGHVHRMAANPNATIAAANTDLTARHGNGQLDWTGSLRLVSARLDKPFGWKEPHRVFVNSLSDLFHAQVRVDWIAQIFAVMAMCPHHTFQVLTKRAERMADLLSDLQFAWDVWSRTATVRPDAPWPLPNVWLGVSVEDQQRADERIPWLLKTPAAVRFLSCEPLLGPVDLRKLHTGWCEPGWSTLREVYPLDGLMAIPDCDWEVGAIDWVIGGGESGSQARPWHVEWARSLRDQCRDAGVAWFWKQNGEWVPFTEDLLSRHNLHSVRVTLDGRVLGPDDPDAPGQVYMARVGKKAAGNLLDGERWEQFPEVTS